MATDYKQMKADAIAALMALGHKKAQATRMVNAALNKPGITTVQELIREAYRQPISVIDGRPSQPTQAVSSPWAMAFYAYQTGAAVAGPDAELLQIARAVGPGLTLEEFEQLGLRVNSVKANRGAMNNRQYQEALWAIPDSFSATRSNPVHFQPARDPSGRPVDTAIEPIPQRSLESIAAVEPSAPSLTSDAIREAVAPAAPEPTALPPARAAETPAPVTPEAIQPTISQPAPVTPSPEATRSLLQQAATSTALAPDPSPASSSTVNITNMLGQLVNGPESSPPTPRPDNRQSQPTIVEPGSTPQAIAALVNAQPSPEPERSTAGSNTLDQMQAAADAIGVVDQTGITDLGNAGVSLARAFWEPDRAGHHLFNAGVSAVSAIPLVGDAAKLLKYGRSEAKAIKGASAANGSFGDMAGHHVGNFFNRRNRAASAIDNEQAAYGSQSHHWFGSGGGGGNGPIDLGPYATGDGGGSEDAKQAGRDLASFTESIQGFIEKVTPAATAVVAFGSAVYERALKPLVDWLKQIDETSKKMLADNKHLAAYSGELSTAMQKLDAERFMRDVAKAQT